MSSPFQKSFNEKSPLAQNCDAGYKAYIAKNSKDHYVDDSDGAGPKTFVKARDPKNLLSKEKYCENTRDKRVLPKKTEKNIKKEQDK